MHSNLLSLIIREKWAILHEIADAYKPNILNLLQGKPFFPDEIPEREDLKLSLASAQDDITVFTPWDEYDQAPDKTVAVIPIRGTMIKFGNMCIWGMDEMAAFVDQAMAHGKISAVILRIHSGGGTWSSTVQLEESLRKADKPVIALVDNMAASAAYYVASFTDRIVGINKMAEVGSIGVMTMLINDKNKMEKEGVELIKIYPPESKWKNKAVNEALEGKAKLLIDEELSPLALHFQQIVKTNRGDKLNLNVEGIVEGRMFYGEDAVKYGLVDEILSFDDTVRLAVDMARNLIMQSLI